jgi:glycine betaine/choline ABC-type transport system substrate-binding protein
LAGDQDGLDTLSNEIDEDLKRDLDIAVAGSDYTQKEVLSAMIDHCLCEEDGRKVVDQENLEELLEEYGERYSTN